MDDWSSSFHGSLPSPNNFERQARKWQVSPFKSLGCLNQCLNPWDSDPTTYQNGRLMLYLFDNSMVNLYLINEFCSTYKYKFKIRQQWRKQVTVHHSLLAPCETGTISCIKFAMEKMVPDQHGRSLIYTPIIHYRSHIKQVPRNYWHILILDKLVSHVTSFGHNCLFRIYPNMLRLSY